MLAVADLGHGLDPARGHAGLVEALQPVRGRARREDRVQERHEDLAIGHAAGFGIEARILCELFPADGAAHPVEERVVRHAQRHVRVLGLENLVGHDGRVLVSAAGRPAAAVPVQARLIGQERGHDVQHADLDLLALARAGAREKREGHAVSRRHAGDEIGDGVAHLDGGAVGEAGEIHDARLALHDEIVAGARGLGAALAEARDGAVDQARVQLAKGVVAEAQPRHGAGPEVLQHHVGLGHEPTEDGLSVGRFHVEGQALLVAVDGEKVRRLAAGEGRPAARVVPLARFLDLDDLRPHVPQDHRAERAGEHARQVEHADARERRPSSASFLSLPHWGRGPPFELRRSPRATGRGLSQ